MKHPEHSPGKAQPEDSLSTGMGGTQGTSKAAQKKHSRPAKGKQANPKHCKIRGKAQGQGKPSAAQDSKNKNSTTKALLAESQKDKVET